MLGALAPAALADPDFGPGNSSAGPNDGNASATRRADGQHAQGSSKPPLRLAPRSSSRGRPRQVAHGDARLADTAANGSLMRRARAVRRAPASITSSPPACTGGELAPLRQAQRIASADCPRLLRSALVMPPSRTGVTVEARDIDQAEGVPRPSPPRRRAPWRRSLSCCPARRATRRGTQLQDSSFLRGRGARGQSQGGGVRRGSWARGREPSMRSGAWQRRVGVEQKMTSKTSSSWISRTPSVRLTTTTIGIS